MAAIDHLLKIAFIGFCLILLQSEAYSTNITSVVRTVQIAKTTASPARTSVQMVGGTSCPVIGWFAFEDADTGVGLLWTKLIVTASQSGKQLTVYGTGTCDSSGVEGVRAIDLK